MNNRFKRSEENKRVSADKPVRDQKLNKSGKYDTETGAIEVPDGIPHFAYDSDGKVIFNATAEGVVGDVSSPEKDPMNIDKKY